MDSGFLGPYYGLQISGFRSQLQTFTWFSVPQEKTSRIRNPESLIFYVGRLLIAFPFFVTTFIYLLTWFNLCLYCAVSQDIPIIWLEVVICIVFVCFNGASARPFRSGPPHLSMPENLVMTSAYARCLSIQILRVGVRKLGKVENEVSDICVAVPFDEKLTILRTTNGVACVRLIIGLLSEINFLGFTFAWSPF